MGKYEKLDSILKENLKAEYEPTSELNQKIFQRAKEEKMRKKIRPVAAAIAGVCIFGSIGTYAAVKYLTPSEVASEIYADKYLAAAFEGEHALQINEQVSEDGYIFTLLGITSGYGLNTYFDENGQEFYEDESYAVIAMEKEDGSAMTAVSDNNYDIGNFLVSPLLGDQNPWEVNIYSLSGGAAETVKDGIAYRIISCKELNMFADRGVYIAVCDGLEGLSKGYEVDKESCSISRNESYTGLNVLFQLPLDKKQADPVMAAQVLDEILNPVTDESDIAEYKAEYNENLLASDDLESWQTYLGGEVVMDDLLKYCHMVDGSEQIVFPDEEGIYKVYRDGDLSEYMNAEFIEKNGEWQLSGYSCADTLESLHMSMYHYNEDGSVRFAVFTPN